MTEADWFATTPEAVLRVEGLLTAFREARLDDVGAILSLDAEADANPMHTIVALIGMCDRLAASTAKAEGIEHTTALRDAARVTATAIYLHKEQ